MRSFSNRDNKSECSRVCCFRRSFRFTCKWVWALLSLAVLVQVWLYEWALPDHRGTPASFVVQDLERDLLFRSRPLSENGLENKFLSYLRVQDAVLTVRSDQRTVLVLCSSRETCRSVAQRDGETLFLNERTNLHVRAAYRSASITVRFVLDPAERSAIQEACRQSEGGWEPRTTIYQPLTPFLMKNLAHWTFDLVYPLYATISLLERNHVQRLVRMIQPPGIVFDTTGLQRPNHSALRLPSEARRLLRRLGRISTQMTPIVEYRSLGQASGTTLCFRDLVLGAREQNLRKSNWDYYEAPVSMRRQRQKLMNGFRTLMQRYARQRCRLWRSSGNTMKEQGKPWLIMRLFRGAARERTLILGRGSVRRQLRNATTLVREMRNAEYIDAFGSLPWCRQYAYIHNAGRLVAMHGAEWSHLFLVRNPTHLRSIELFPPCAKPLTFYAAVAKHLGIQHHTMLRTSASTQMEFDERFPQQRQCIAAMQNRSTAFATLPKRCCLDANIVLSSQDQLRILSLLTGYARAQRA